MSFVELKMDASRICNGLAHIGYTPVSAICDIVDNSVSAEATNIRIEIVPEKNVSDNKRNNVREYRIIDDGKGMDEARLQEALALGATDAHYTPGMLSKFGLGLKSAGFSQGETLIVLSSPGDGAPFVRYVVRLARIAETGQYGADKEPLTDEDNALIAETLPGGRGTVVRIADVRSNNHPAIRATVSELQAKIGIIYYYFLADGDLTISVDGKPCEPFDVLCVAEANTNGAGLDEYTWDGRTVRWIQKPINLPIDKKNGIIAVVEATQLPNPPTFEKDGAGEQARIRERYRIAAANYGYYIYRNKRLISWAERFQLPDGPIIPQDQDMYAFRGRIQLDEKADDALNIDVKKSDIMLSDEAEKALREYSDDYKRKSRDAWRFRTSENKRIANLGGDKTIDKLARDAEPPEDLPGSLADDSEEAFARQKEREQEIVAEQDRRFDEEAKELAQEDAPGLDISAAPEKFAEYKQEAISGENRDPDSKIFYVRNTDDFALWEPYFDPEKRNCVRINRDHKFGRLLQRSGERYPEARAVISLMLFNLAAAEVYVRKNYPDLKSSEVEAVLKAYRDAASNFLATLAVKSGDKIFGSE